MTSKTSIDRAGLPCVGDPPLITNQNGAAALLQAESGEAIWVPVASHQRGGTPGLRYDVNGSGYARAFFVSMFSDIPQEMHEEWMLGCYVVMRGRGHWSYNLAMEQRLADLEADAQSELPPPASPTYIQ